MLAEAAGVSFRLGARVARPGMKDQALVAQAAKKAKAEASAGTEPKRRGRPRKM